MVGGLFRQASGDTMTKILGVLIPILFSALFAVIVIALAGCAPRHQSDDWGALSQQVGKQLNK
jgi:hypothetical protein